MIKVDVFVLTQLKRGTRRLNDKQFKINYTLKYQISDQL